jgi:hypothetical protein
VKRRFRLKSAPIYARFCWVSRLKVQIRRNVFDQAFRLLAQAPGIGHYHEELLDARYRFWNFYSYVVCYRWRKKIEIIAVIHGARDLAVFLSTRTGFE